MTTLPVFLSGHCLHPGSIVGYAHVHTPPESTPTYELYYDLAFEEAKLHKGLEQLQVYVEQFLSEETSILEPYRFLASDPVWHERLYMSLREERCFAEESVRRVLESYRSVFKKHPFWEERFYDLQDLSHQLLRLMQGDVSLSLLKPLILVAHQIGPSDVLRYYKHGLCGAILGTLGKTSHAAILLQSLGIPTVINIDVDHIHSKDYLFLEATSGQVHTKSFQVSASKKTALKRSEDSLSRDGVALNFFASIAMEGDMQALKHPQIQGVGLYRTEFSFLTKGYFLSFDEQVALYKTILSTSHGKPVYFRLLDLSGDKAGVLFRTDRQRLSISSAELNFLMRTQVRALMTAHLQYHSSHPLFVVIPMVATSFEFHTISNIIKQEKLCDVKIGVMIEIPSIIFELEHLLPCLDFITIGSNDLFHFLHAIERGHPSSYQELSPGFFRILKQIQDMGSTSHIPTILCGQIAIHGLSFLALLGIGIRSFSIIPHHLEKLLMLVSKTNIQHISQYIAYACYAETSKKPSQCFRKNFENYVRDHLDVSEDLLM